jgi:hypothetical protein
VDGLDWENVTPCHHLVTAEDSGLLFCPRSPLLPLFTPFFRSLSLSSLVGFLSWRRRTGRARRPSPRSSSRPSPATSIHQVCGRLPFASFCAKSSASNLNASYLYSDLTRLQVIPTSFDFFLSRNYPGSDHTWGISSLLYLVKC